jgi:hypothetical protein
MQIAKINGAFMKLDIKEMIFVTNLAVQSVCR